MEVDEPELIQILFSESAPTLFVPVSWMTDWEPTPPTTRMSLSLVTLREPASVPVEVQADTLALPANRIVPDRTVSAARRKAPMPPAIQNCLPLGSVE